MFIVVKFQVVESLIFRTVASSALSEKFIFQSESIPLSGGARGGLIVS